MIYRKDITAERARQLLQYNDHLGILIWKYRTPEMFEGRKRPADVLCKIWNKKFAGKIAGGDDCHKGYRTISVESIRYFEHRIIWLIVHGEWPKDQIDHRFGVKFNNKIEELREANESEQRQNQKIVASNSSGKTGVSWHKAASKWMAYINHENKRYYLGLFQTVEAASDAYLRAKKRLHLFQPTPMEA
jgi:hypothetical protein